MEAPLLAVKVVDGLTGNELCSLDVSDSLSVHLFKEVIQDTLLLPSYEQRLFVAGRLLQSNSASLGDVLDETREVSLLRTGVTFSLDETREVSLLRTGVTFECFLEAPLAPILGIIVCAEATGSLLVRNDRRKGSRGNFISDTAIHSWNRTQPNSQIVLGDSIIMVNDVGTDSKAMLAELRAAESLKLLVRPGATRNRSDGMLDMKRTSFCCKSGDVAL